MNSSLRVIPGLTGMKGLLLDITTIEGCLLLRGAKTIRPPFSSRSKIRYPSIALKPLVIICAIAIAVHTPRGIVTSTV